MIYQLKNLIWELAAVEWNQAPVPLTIFRSNSKLDQNLECSNLKSIYPDHDEILPTSQQCNCRDVCKILLWLIEYILH